MRASTRRTDSTAEGAHGRNAKIANRSSSVVRQCYNSVAHWLVRVAHGAHLVVGGAYGSALALEHDPQSGRHVGLQRILVLLDGVILALFGDGFRTARKGATTRLPSGSTSASHPWRPPTAHKQSRIGA